MEYKELFWFIKWYLYWFEFLVFFFVREDLLGNINYFYIILVIFLIIGILY